MPSQILAHAADLQADPFWNMVVVTGGGLLALIGVGSLIGGKKLPAFLSFLERAATPLLVIGVITLLAGPYLVPEVHPPTPEVDCASRPSTDAVLKVISPQEGEAFNTNTIPIEVEVEGGLLTSADTSRVVEGEGHLHVAVDGRIISMTRESSGEVTVPTGPHTLTFEYSAGDHAPFCPQVVEERNVEVRLDG